MAGWGAPIVSTDWWGWWHDVLHVRHLPIAGEVREFIAWRSSFDLRWISESEPTFQVASGSLLKLWEEQWLPSQGLG
eukprot:s2104_g6.t1